jgi:hypothetical protein
VELASLRDEELAAKDAELARVKVELASLRDEELAAKDAELARVKVELASLRALLPPPASSEGVPPSS